MAAERRSSSEGALLPVAEKTPADRSLHPGFYIFCWIFFSNLTILFNKWLIDSAGFTIILTTWHLIFATIATQLLARTTSLLDSRRKIPITGRMYMQKIVPIGVLYSGSLVCSNLVYLYLSVAFIQMLKSASPVAVLFVSWLFGVASPSLSQVANIMVIVLGVAMASLGEVKFSLLGFIFQCGGIVFEALRIVMIQVMLSGDDMKMDPLVGLYYYAPVCAVMNVFVAWAFEWRDFQWADLQKTGVTMLVLNAGVAFMLNVASVFLIGKTSGLIMTLTGILKNILLVIISVVIWNTDITSLQCLGYSVALAGLTYYSLGKEQILSLLSGTSAWSRDIWHAPSSEGRIPLSVRRALVVIGLTIGLAALLLYTFGGGIAMSKLSIITSWFASE